MIKIYHNPRCRKSRDGLKLLEDKTSEIVIHKYMDHGLTHLEITEILKKLNIKPDDLVRKNEKVWKDLYKNKILSDNQIIDAMQAHPQLIERPIVIKNEKGVIGRPSSNITDLLNS